MDRAISLRSRKIRLLALSVCIAVLAGACGEGLSLVAVDTEATPLPFKTPRIAETPVEPETDPTLATTPVSESETQPAIETDEGDAPVAEGAAVEVEEPTATPEPDPGPAPSTTDPLAGSNAEDVSADDLDSWRLGIVENPAARNIALRAHEVSADLLVIDETADVTRYYEIDLIGLAFRLDVRSFYGVLTFTALPSGSAHQVESPILFFEQIVIHESSQDAAEFLETYRVVVVDFFLEQGTGLMNAAMPGVFEPGGSSEVVGIPPPALADEVIFLVVEWPMNATASDLSPRMHIAILRQGDVTAAIALGSTDESQAYRFIGIVERLISRMS